MAEKKESSLNIILPVFAVLAVITLGIFWYYRMPRMPARPAGIPNTTADIIVYSPQVEEEIMSPLEISGVARGNWYFEAVFPIRLYDAHSNLIASGQARAEGEWTTLDFVPFKAELSFQKPKTATGVLILVNDNPSGSAQNAKQIGIPVIFGK